MPVLLHLLATFDSWSRGLVMVQAEVADRLAARPGSKTYGVPSVKVAWYAAATRLARYRRPSSGRCRTSSLAWWPEPTPAAGDTATRDQVFAVVDAAFAQRRKMLRSALAGLAGSSAAASPPSPQRGWIRKPVARRWTWWTSRDRGADLPSVDNLTVMASSPRGLLPGYVRVPAKINLALKVGASGRWVPPLATVYQAVSVYDEVHAAWADPDEFEVVVSGEGADLVPLDDSNLAVRAAKLLARTMDPRFPRCAFVDQEVHSGGRWLAGGSANGAALLACAVLWDLDVTAEGLRALAAELGSDVPFALLGGTAVGSGRGEDVAPALARGTYHWVLAFGYHGLSTAAVYRRFDELTPTQRRPKCPPIS